MRAPSQILGAPNTQAKSYAGGALYDRPRLQEHMQRVRLAREARQSRGPVKSAREVQEELQKNARKEKTNDTLKGFYSKFNPRKRDSPDEDGGGGGGGAAGGAAGDDMEPGLKGGAAFDEWVDDLSWDLLELYCKQAAKKSDKEDDDAAAGAAQTAETEPEPDCEVNPNPQPRAKDSGPVDSVDDPSEALRARGFAQASSRVANG